MSGVPLMRERENNIFGFSVRYDVQLLLRVLDEVDSNCVRARHTTVLLDKKYFRSSPLLKTFCTISA